MWLRRTQNCENTDRASNTEPNCKNCGQAGHLTEKCKNAVRCKNCKRSHRSDSEKCHRLRQRTYDVNDYVIGIINNESEILRNPQAESNGGVDRDELEEIVGEMITKIETIRTINERFERKENKNALIKEKLNELVQSDENLLDRINSVEHNLENTKLTLLEKIDSTTKAQSEASEKASDKIDLLIELMRQQQTKQNKMKKIKNLKEIITKKEKVSSQRRMKRKILL